MRSPRYSAPQPEESCTAWIHEAARRSAPQSSGRPRAARAAASRKVTIALAAALALGTTACEKSTVGAENHAGRGQPTARASAANPVVPSGDRADPSRPWPPLDLPKVETAWCGRSMPGLAEDACYALPPRPSRDLLIYLPGIVPPQQASPQLENLQRVLAEAARNAGAVVLLPRGRTDLSPPKYPGWWSWPTTRSAFERSADTLVKEIEARQRHLEDALSFRFRRRYLAGSSAGAYFVVRLAVEGRLKANGYGALSGGAPVPTSNGNDAGDARTAPFYVGYGIHDSQGVTSSAAALAATLRERHWPTLVRTHPVGHGARGIYLEEAFAFWRGESPPDHSSVDRVPNTPARRRR